MSGTQVSVERPPENVGGAGDSRQAILRVARRLFAAQGYADVKLRDIAHECGVSAALVVKHFGSKETLYARAVSFEREAAMLLDSELPALGEHLIRTLLTLHEQEQSDPFLRAVLTAIGRNGTEFNQSFRHHFVEPLAARMTGDDAELRAELITSHLIGLGGVRRALRLPAVCAVTAEQIVDHLGRLLQGYIDGTGPAPGNSVKTAPSMSGRDTR